MANLSIGGLVSGLDTASIISQLMQLEARPQTMLKSKVSTEQKVVSALQALNTKAASIATKAAELAKATAWSPSKSTSSNENVTVATGAGAVPATLNLTVGRLATAHTIDYGLHALTDRVTTDGSTSVVLDKLDGTTVTLDTKDGTVQGLVNALNATDNGARASLVRVADGSYRLQVTSTSTGASSDFALTDAAGNPLAITGTATAGQSAQITVGSDLIESESNTLTGLMPGVDVTLLSGATGAATITVERDVTALSDSVKAMVESVNAVLSEINTLTAYDATTKKSGLLAGDSTLRTVRNQLLESVTHGIAGESLAPYGVQTDRSGKLVFDEEKFKAAYAADPAKTSAMIGGTDTADGFADKLQALGKVFSDSIDGTITTAIKSRQSAIKGMEDDIADWDVRLATRQSSLQRQYTALETALGKLQSQGNWLAGQLASLPQMSSGQ
jgi:flagellar hook-associated protein 2